MTSSEGRFKRPAEGQDEWHADEDFQEELDEYRLLAAQQTFADSLRNADYNVPITHCDSVEFKGCIFQGHAAAIQEHEDVGVVIEKLKSVRPWAKAKCLSYAYRVLPSHALELEEDAMYSREQLEALVVEGASDGGDVGVGGKLLHLLRKWEVFNAILLVSRRDEGRPGRLRADRYAVIIDRVGFERK